MTRRPRARAGTTLVELLVVLCILGVIAGVSVMAVRQFEPPAPTDPRAIMADSLRAAVDAPRTIVVRVVQDGRPASATIHPDGSVVGDSALGTDRFTGRSLHAK